MTGNRDLPMLTVKEAVDATQTSESTIKRGYVQARSRTRSEPTTESG